MTRFGEISPLWQKIKLFGNLLRVYLVFGKKIPRFWPNFNPTGPIFNVVCDQQLKIVNDLHKENNLVLANLIPTGNFSFAWQSYTLQNSPQIDQPIVKEPYTVSHL